MKKLKILQVINVRWYNAEADYALKLSRSLNALGHDVTIMGLPTSPVINMATQEGFKTVTNISLNTQNPFSILLSFFKLKKILKDKQFDIVNFHRSEGFFAGALACSGAGIKVVRTRGDMRPVRKGFLNRLLYNKLTDFIITSNNTIKQSIISRLNTAEEKIKTIYVAVDTDFFNPSKRTKKLHDEFNIPDGSKVAAILGRLGNVKGHKFFIKAMRIVRDRYRNAKFLIIGKSVENEGNGIQELVKELSMESDIHFIMDTRSDIDELAASIDVGVITSTASEANCRVALEWMSSGVPVVSFATGVIPELVASGKDGFIVPIGNYEALADKICNLMEDDGKWNEFSANARITALEKFNLTRFGEETVKVYEGSIAK